MHVRYWVNVVFDEQAPEGKNFGPVDSKKDAVDLLKVVSFRSDVVQATIKEEKAEFEVN